MFKPKIIAEMLLQWVKTIITSLSISLFITLFLFQPFYVEGSSMEPTFKGGIPYSRKRTGDFIMVSNIYNEPDYGDIVIVDGRKHINRTFKNKLLENPVVSGLVTRQRNNRHLWIKRVIGKAGDKIEFKDGHLYRNDVLIVEDYLKEGMRESLSAITVPEDHVFVMGDNRNVSLDSRHVGPLPARNIVGKVFVRIFPFNKINTF
jgi:signal peptidase I